MSGSTIASDVAGRSRPPHRHLPGRHRRFLLLLLLLLSALVVPVLLPGGSATAADTGHDSATAWKAFMADRTRHLPRSGYPWQHCFRASAREYDLPEALLLAVGRGESALDPIARSHANAYGIMQIQWPGTAYHLGIHSLRLLLDPCRNIDAGARYLRELLGRYGDLHLALAAYNVGPGRVDETGREPMPNAGRRYSAYIYRQLSKDALPADSAALLAGLSSSDSGAGNPPAVRAGGAVSVQVTGAAEAGRDAVVPGEYALVEFSSAFRARSLADALSRRYPTLELQTRVRDGSGHVVTVITPDRRAWEQARRDLGAAGFELPGL